MLENKIVEKMRTKSLWLVKSERRLCCMENPNKNQKSVFCREFYAKYQKLDDEIKRKSA